MIWATKYKDRLDRQSAFEILAQRTKEAADAAEAAEQKEVDLDAAMREYNAGRRYSGTRVGTVHVATDPQDAAKTESFGEAMVNVVVKELKGTTGRRIVRGILGGLFKAR